MNSDNPLNRVYNAFSVESDCFKVAAYTIRVQHKEFIRATGFMRTTREKAKTVLQDAEKQAADLAVLALFATFERFVIEHLQSANHLLAAGYPQQYSAKLAEKFGSEVEYWRFVEILNLFKGEIDADLVGRVKQIKQYRDWIARQNPNKPTPTQATPQTVFDVLTRMIDQIRLTHTPPAERQVAEAAIG